MSQIPLGLYIHIPFCSKICHYCDFAKTANFTEDHIQKYLEKIEKHFEIWCSVLQANQKFTSVFFGGGTPGILSKQYKSLMAKVMKSSYPGAEVTLESNPGNVTPENAKIWRDLGFNRLSIGVQTFDKAGLIKLTRDHTSDEALSSLEIAGKYFSKSNGDLIYGWSGQSEASWQNDLELMANSGVNHMSLYALTFEGETPFARANKRGVMPAMADDLLANRYDFASNYLRSRKFKHEEISNWSNQNASCEHNWVYWRGQNFIGIGAGAHGYVDDGSPFGLRYSYPGDLRGFLKNGEGVTEVLGSNAGPDFQDVIKRTAGLIDNDRNIVSWSQEYVGCALRTEEGVNLKLLGTKGFKFEPNQILQRAIKERLLMIEGDYLRATEAEWFRETSWSYQICESLVHI